MQTRNTQQRQLVRDLLAGNPSHPTADEVYGLARKRNPTISRGTVYRNLNLLAQSGEIRRLQMPAGPDHYDFATEPHHHFLCRKCGRVLDAGISCRDLLAAAGLSQETGSLPEDGPASAGPPALAGCKLETCSLVLGGLCPVCNGQEK